MGYIGNYDFTKSKDGLFARSYINADVANYVNKECGTNLTVADLQLYCRKMFVPAATARAGKLDKYTRLFTKRNLVENVKNFILDIEYEKE